ncbi:hypothetical protein L7F22_002783 [Adiantum nelumboides]|nr:hypothetical protein [Adiantum nelumboides]
MAEGQSSKPWGGGGYNTFGGNGGGRDGGSNSSSDESRGTGRPWAELLHRPAFVKPTSTRDAFSRIRKNLSYFRRNYALIMLVLIGLSLLWRPISLIVLAVLSAAWIYLYFSRTGPYVICNRPIGENFILALLTAVTIVALAFTPSAGIPLLASVLIWLVAILVHGAFRLPHDDSSPDGQEHASLLSKKAGGVGKP